MIEPVPKTFMPDLHRVPISTRGADYATTLLLVPLIFRPSYGPASVHCIEIWSMWPQKKREVVIVPGCCLKPNPNEAKDFMKLEFHKLY